MLEPGKCLWFFLQAEFWCLGVWAVDGQDVPAGREWLACSPLARSTAVMLLSVHPGSRGGHVTSQPLRDSLEERAWVTALLWFRQRSERQWRDMPQLSPTVPTLF